MLHTYLLVLYGERVVAIEDTVTEEVDATLALTDLPQVVEVVGALASAACGCTPGVEVETLGYAVRVVAVAACQVVAGDDGTFAAHFGNVGESHEEAAQTHVEA